MTQALYAHMNNKKNFFKFESKPAQPLTLARLAGHNVNLIRKQNCLSKKLNDESSYWDWEGGKQEIVDE
jgi:hypothetical protein